MLTMQSTGHRKRCRRYNEPGEAHFLTFSCFRRQPFLTRDRSCAWLADSLNRALAKHAYHLWAYVFMPEHVHLLLWPTRPGYQISRVLAGIKQPVTTRAVRFLRAEAPNFLSHLRDQQPNGTEHYRVWQRGGGYDRNLTDPKEIWQKIDYIHNNPVVRKLCDLAEDWRWFSTGYYLDQRPGPVLLNLTALPAKNEFVNRTGVAESTWP